MEEKIKEKIVELIKKKRDYIGQGDKREMMVANQIIKLFKQEVLDLSTFKTKEERQVLEEIKHYPILIAKFVDTPTDNLWRKIKDWQEKLK